MLVKQRGRSDWGPKRMRQPWRRGAGAAAPIVEVVTTTPCSANTRSYRIVDVAWKMSSPLFEKHYGTSMNICFIQGQMSD
jgi:hypothetical protein